MNDETTSPAREAEAQATRPASTSSPESRAAGRLVSLDAYRGFIMLAMASGGVGFATVAQEFPDSALWQELRFHFTHVQWVGCSFWDLIQPSFMFMVGVALPYSFASRLARGHSRARITAHALWRSAVLVFLGVFLSSNWSRETNYTFVNVLTQIGLGYPLLYLLVGRGWRLQLVVAALILFGYWLAFAVYPAAASSSMPGFFAHWEKNANLAADFDVWLLNLFPRSEPFVANSGGYQTLNFVPSIATMIFGVLAGELLRGDSAWREKLRTLVGCGLLAIVLGTVLGWWVCPVVKRIWTPSWAIYSTGWTLLMLAFFYLTIDIPRWRRWSWPFVVVGMNSIAMYCMAQLLKPWIRDTYRVHLGQDIFSGPYAKTWEAAAVLFALWLVCVWMWRRKIFLRI